METCSFWGGEMYARKNAASFGTASGKRVEGFVFATWKGRTYVKRYAKPHNPRSEKQQRHRRLFREAVQSFRALLPEEKERLNREANARGITGLNLFMHRYMRERESAGKSAEPEFIVVF